MGPGSSVRPQAGAGGWLVCCAGAAAPRLYERRRDPSRRRACTFSHRRGAYLNGGHLLKGHLRAQIAASHHHAIRHLRPVRPQRRQACSRPGQLRLPVPGCGTTQSPARASSAACQLSSCQLTSIISAMLGTASHDSICAGQAGSARAGRLGTGHACLRTGAGAGAREANHAGSAVPAPLPPTTNATLHRPMRFPGAQS